MGLGPDWPSTARPMRSLDVSPSSRPSFLSMIAEQTRRTSLCQLSFPTNQVFVSLCITARRCFLIHHCKYLSHCSLTSIHRKKSLSQDTVGILVCRASHLTMIADSSLRTEIRLPQAAERRHNSSKCEQGGASGRGCRPIKA